jgi:hypothetical protein
MDKNVDFYFRIIHWYLGFYLVGIIAFYAISGIAMIFRNDNTFKIISELETTLPLNLDESTLRKALKINRLSVEKVEGDQLFFKEGTYN